MTNTPRKTGSDLFVVDKNITLSVMVNKMMQLRCFNMTTNFKDLTNLCLPIRLILPIRAR